MPFCTLAISRLQDDLSVGSRLICSERMKNSATPDASMPGKAASSFNMMTVWFIPSPTTPQPNLEPSEVRSIDWLIM
jgi:hypothetical protein